MWQPNESVLSGITNPQATGVEGDIKGSYVFALLFPGQYTVTAEKYGYKGSASVHINNTTIHSPYSVTVAIQDFDADLTQEQAQYHGAITGVVYDRSQRVMTRYANVSLWQNEKMVVMPKNPQKGGNTTYVFKHVAPGHYAIRAEMSAMSFFSGIVVNASVWIDTVNVTADMILPSSAPSGPHPTQVPSPTPTQVPTEVPSTATPAPSVGVIMVLLSIGYAGVLICKSFRKKQ